MLRSNSTSPALITVRGLIMTFHAHRNVNQDHSHWHWQNYICQNTERPTQTVTHKHTVINAQRTATDKTVVKLQFHARHSRYVETSRYAARNHIDQISNRFAYRIQFNLNLWIFRRRYCSQLSHRSSTARAEAFALF